MQEDMNRKAMGSNPGANVFFSEFCAEVYLHDHPVWNSHIKNEWEDNVLIVSREVDVPLTRI